MSSGLVRSSLMAPVAMGVVFTAMVIAAPSSALPAGPAQDDFPTMAGAAMRFYESRIDNWNEGPAEMLMTIEEHEIWDSLEDDMQRQEFKRWFWYRRDPDGRQIGNSFQESFYEEVAEANKMYRGFPRGWKSDRGRVRCILGPPDVHARRAWGDLYGSGNGPDFDVWSYFSLTGGRAFTGQSGEFNIYFIEERIGSFQIYDFRWGAGVWERNIRLAIEWTIDEGIIDPIELFETSASTGEFVREISEGTLPVVIPLDLWAVTGGGGMISVPVEIELGDLLFESVDGEFVARLDAAMALQRAGQGDAIRVEEAWQVRLSQEQLIAVGSGSLITALSAEVGAGNYDATVVVQHPLAAADAEWSQSVEVSDEPVNAIVVGKLALRLNDQIPSAVAVVAPSDATFESGGPLVLGIWARGAEPRASAVSVQLETVAGETHVVTIEDPVWLGGAAGPLLIETRLPDLEPGEYQLRVDLGVGLDFASTPITIGG